VPVTVEAAEGRDGDIFAELLGIDDKVSRS